VASLAMRIEEKMFLNAENFHYSTQVLDSLIQNHVTNKCKGIPPTLTPMITLSALTIELYFKTIYAMENGGKSPGKIHDLLKLFGMLKKEPRGYIKKIADVFFDQVLSTIQKLHDGVKSENVNLMRFALVTLGDPLGTIVFDTCTPVKSPLYTEDVLKESRLAFSQYRYAHEDRTTGYALRVIEFVSRQFILEKESTWARHERPFGPQATFQVH
jgi:hypothetical protein